jgi:hypothetical protein
MGTVASGRLSRFESLQAGNSAETTCALCGGAGRVWRDRQGFLQQTFEHEEPCLLEVLIRHVSEEIRLRLGLGMIQRRLLAAELSDPGELQNANLLVTGWIDRLLAGEDIASSSYDRLR